MRPISNIINDILIMPNSREKDVEVVNLCNYLKYLNMIGKLTDNNYKEFQDIITIMFSNTFKYTEKERIILLNDFYDQKEKLSDLYQEVLLFAKDYKLDIKNLTKFNNNEYKKYIIDFLKWFDEDLLNIYINLDNNGLIHKFIHDRYIGFAYQIGKDEYAIMINQENELQTLITMIHELGHIYYYHINRNNPELIPRYLPSECISTSLERIFIIYLKQNNLIDNTIISEYENNKHIKDLMKMDCSYVVNKTLVDNNSNNRIITYEDYKKIGILSHKSFKDCEFHLRYRQNKYSYALLFSSVIEERFIKDENWVKHFLKEYPKLVKEQDSKTLINLFYANHYINATNRKTNKVLVKKSGESL